MRLFFDLTKSGIVVFVLVTGMAGYAMSQPLTEPWNFTHLLLTLGALYFLSAGSFAINQAQEVHVDRLMPRTSERPVPSRRISKAQAWVLGVGFVLLGSIAALLINSTVFFIGIGTVFLYNVMYTLWWKRHWAFGAVPGAIPGATPVLIGYAAHYPTFGTMPLAEPVYLFLLMFLWQMPHFWSLAIRFRDDYRAGGIPVLPVAIGTDRTVYHIALYVFAYVATAAAAPFFTSAGWAYGFAVLPIVFAVLWQFLKFHRSVIERHEKSRWLPFFLWTNLSILIFLSAPVVDRWAQHAYLMSQAGIGADDADQE